MYKIITAPFSWAFGSAADEPKAPAGKRGLAWGAGTPGPIDDFVKKDGKVTWLHNWSTKPHVEGLGKDVEWVPLQWNAEGIENLADLVKSPPSPSKPDDGKDKDGDKDKDKDGDKDKAKAKPSSSSLPSAKAVLAFSEPEQEWGAKMTTEEAAKQWLKHIEPLRKKGVRAGSPGISSSETGIAWMQEFITKIRAEGSDVDFWALHWYGPNDLGAIINYLWGTHARLGNTKPVWITEFACSTWDINNPIEQDKVTDFLKGAITYFDTLDWIERYAWNGPSKDPGALGKYATLIDDEGKINELGKIYRDT